MEHGGDRRKAKNRIKYKATNAMIFEQNRKNQRKKILESCKQKPLSKNGKPNNGKGDSGSSWLEAEDVGDMDVDNAGGGGLDFGAGCGGCGGCGG